MVMTQAVKIMRAWIAQSFKQSFLNNSWFSRQEKTKEEIEVSSFAF